MAGREHGDDGERLLGAQAAARYLGVHRSTLHLAIRRGMLVPDERTPGGHARFRAETLDAYRAQLGKRTATGEAAVTVALRGVRMLTQRLLARDSFAAISQTAVEVVRQALAGIEMCGVALVTPRPGDPHAMRPIASYGLPDEALEEFGRSRRTFRFATTTALRTLEAVVNENVERGQVHTGTQRIRRLWPFAAYAVYPLVVGEQARGVLACTSPRPRRFTASERVFLEAIANLLALASESEWAEPGT